MNYTSNKINFTFTPHLSPMFRGILSTIYLELKSNVSLENINKILKNFYMKDRFIKILKINSIISTNDVVNTNNCYISVCKTKYKNKIIILSAIDNLIKGGAGQAVQNLNLKYNFPISRGLLEIFLIILTLIFLNNCSFDKNSNFWLEKNKNNNNKKTKEKIFSEFDNPMVLQLKNLRFI